MKETANQHFSRPPVGEGIHIFIDLDGVIADFDGHATKTGKFTAAGHVKWDELDHNWWASMPVMPGAKDFYDAAKKEGTVRFLTAPSLDPSSFSGKAAWAMGFVPERGKTILKDLIICPSADKQYLAKPNHILIDDRIKNVEQWRAAGGIAIHHKGDFAETTREFQKALALLKAPKPNAPPQTPKP